jgi:hypothetical protein
MTTNTTEIQRIIRFDFEKLCFNKLKNLEEMDTYDLPKLNQVIFFLVWGFELRTLCFLDRCFTT